MPCAPPGVGPPRVGRLRNGEARFPRTGVGFPAMQRVLIVVGVGLVLAGLLWPWLSKFPWGRLPGDVSIVRENFSFHFPLMTSIVVSIVLTLIVWWLRK